MSVTSSFLRHQGLPGKSSSPTSATGSWWRKKELVTDICYWFLGPSSFLRHQGLPGLQAQKWVATENVSASPMVTGTPLAIVTIGLALTFSVATHFWACNPGKPWWRKKELGPRNQ